MGLLIRRIETEQLVGVREIANIAGVSAPAVNNWIARHEDFPTPLARLQCGPVFYWPEVKQWLDK